MQTGSGKGWGAPAPACSRALPNRTQSLAQSWDSPPSIHSLCSRVQDVFSSPTIPNTHCCTSVRNHSLTCPCARLSGNKTQAGGVLFRAGSQSVLRGLRKEKEIYAELWAHLCRKEFLLLFFWVFLSRLYLCVSYQEFTFWRVKAAPLKPADIGITTENLLWTQGCTQGSRPWTPQQREMGLCSDALHKETSK